MESGLRQTALSLPFFALARQQTVADQSLKEIRAQRHRLDEVLRIRGEHILDVVGMIKKDRGHVEKTHPHHIAIVARAAFYETERVAIELAHNAHERRAFRARRARGFGFRHADTWRNS